MPQRCSSKPSISIPRESLRVAKYIRAPAEVGQRSCMCTLNPNPEPQTLNPAGSQGELSAIAMAVAAGALQQARAERVEVKAVVTRQLKEAAVR